MRFLCAEIQNVPIKVRNTRDSSVKSNNVQNVQKCDQTQQEILIINLDRSKHTHTHTHTTAWSLPLPEKLQVYQLVKKLFAFYIILNSLISVRNSHHWNIAWTR